MLISCRKKMGKQEKTTHISIHTVHLDGLRELYRHFLVAENGAIVEVQKYIFIYLIYCLM